MTAPLTTSISTRCCIVGGGPAGMMAGLLLARAGVAVEVLEKHGDFLRDFRGDTVHPSTLQLMDELGILNEFLKRPHDEVRQIGGQVGDDFITFADFSYLRTKCNFVALMPQWDFLDFLAAQARQYKTFSLRMNTEATGLLQDDAGRITGVAARSQEGELAIHADLTIAADGRHSVIREAAGLQIEDFGAPMDVLWMRLSRKEGDPPQTLGRIQAGAILVMLNRTTYWQCGFVIAKGGFEQLKSEGIEAFRDRLVQIAPFLEDRVQELETWDSIRLLTVQVDRLREWYREGLLCIGDAAHAMSPIGGVGINLAIQDAVAAANHLYRCLQSGPCPVSALRSVQERRMYPTRMTQRMQLTLQNLIIKRTLQSREKISAPWPLLTFNKLPALRSIPANLIGMGFRPEHIHTPLVRVKESKSV